jgi:hypothetical protein
VLIYIELRGAGVKLNVTITCPGSFYHGSYEGSVRSTVGQLTDQGRAVIVCIHPLVERLPPVSFWRCQSAIRVNMRDLPLLTSLASERVKISDQVTANRIAGNTTP